MLTLKPITTDQEALDAVRRIYLDSFPPQERREWGDLCARAALPGGGLQLIGIYVDSDPLPAGFITLWRLAPGCYVEHFAIDKRLRGSGIGSEAIRRLISDFADGRSVTVEVEPSGSTPEADRRIAFYKRCGFVAHEGYDYVQPPYGPELPPVPLMLMSARPDGLDLDALARDMHLSVYGVEE